MMTKVLVQLLETEKKLPSEKVALLKKTIKNHAQKAGAVLNIPMVNISIYPNSNFVIPETGEGGYTPSKDWIQVYIDSTRKKLELDKIIKTSILLEAVVSEGLAIIFTKEQWRDSKAPWADFSQKEIGRLLAIMKNRERKEDKKYNHAEWFFGSGKLPRWTGYKLGAYVVRSFRKKNMQISWSRIMKMRAKEIVKKSGLKLYE
jgi:uncharacterized protein YjaZ